MITNIIEVKVKIEQNMYSRYRLYLFQGTFGTATTVEIKLPVNYLRIDAFHIWIASAIVTVAFIYVLANLLASLCDLQTDSFNYRPNISRWASVASKSWTKIDASNSRMAGLRQLAFIYISTRRTVTDKPAWARTASKNQLCIYNL